MIELEVIPACQSYGVGIIPWSPLGGGLLGGVLQKVAEGRRADARMQERIEKHRANWRHTKGSAAKSANVLPMWRWHGCSSNLP
jgi:aryl-alcohol dehydrogenase-like predicted oxidoreductase